MPGKAQTVDEYLAAVSPEQRAALEKLRKAIGSAAPKAEECISYQLAAFRLDGRPLVAFGATKSHCAFYPLSGSTVSAYKNELEGYQTSKGTIRFQPSKPLPASLVKKLVKARIAELAKTPSAADASARSKTFRATIVREGSMCFIPLTFDPKDVFGKVRAPVKVTLNGYAYRSTIAAMGGPPCIPLRRSNRESAGLEGGETIDVRLDLDTEKREVKPPADLVKALKLAPAAWERWQALSYSHQREHVEAIGEAKKPETRARRIANAVVVIRRAPAR